MENKMKMNERFEAIARRLESSADVLNTTMLDAEIAELRSLGTLVSVFEIMERVVRGTYDLEYYTPDELYWEAVRPIQDEFLTPGTKEREIRAAVAEWCRQEVEG